MFISLNPSLPMKKLPYLVSGLLATAAATFAQVAPPPAAPAAPTSPEIIELSPFVVNASADVGYQAGNTTSGSRLNTSLKDTSAPITVFTPELISDFGLTNLDDVLKYATNSEKDFEDSNAGFNAPSSRTSAAATPPFRNRGQAASFGVDFIESAVPVDLYSIDRIELSSGPNSVLFGLGAAGGTVALTSKRANLDREREHFKFTSGTFNFSRFEGDVNYVLKKKVLALRLNGLILNREGWRTWDFEDARRLAIGLAYKPFKKTTVYANWEGGTYAKHTDWQWPAADAIKLWVASGRPIKDGFTAATDAVVGITRIGTAPRWTFFDNNGTTLNLNGELQSAPTNPDAAGNYLVLPFSFMPPNTGSGGPGSKLVGNLRNYNFRVEQQWRGFVFEGAYFHTENRAKANGWSVPGNNLAIRGDPNLTIADPATAVAQINPYAGRFYMENNWRPDFTNTTNDVFRITGAYEIKLGKWWGTHSLAGLLESGKYLSDRNVTTEILVNQDFVPIANATNPENGNNTVNRRHYLTEGAYATYYQSSPEEFLRPFTVGANTYSSRYVTLNQNSPAYDYKLTDSAMLATQSSWFNRRLITTLGYRLDRQKLKNVNIARVTADDPRVILREKLVGEWAIIPGQYVNSVFDAKTFTAGAVYHLHPRFSVFANFSNNAGAPRLNTTVLPGGLGPMTKGNSKDYGFMIDVLGDDRYFLRFTKYDTTFLHDTPIQPGTNDFRVNNAAILDSLVAAGRVTEADVTPWRVNFGAFSIDVFSKGYEAEFVANATKNLTIISKFSYSDRNRSNFFSEGHPFYENFKAYLATINTAGNIVNGARINAATVNGTTVADTITWTDFFLDDTEDNQLQPFANRPYKFSTNVRYRFTQGRLKGLDVGGAYTFASDNFMQKDRRTVLNDGVTPNPELNKYYYGNLSENWDFFASYKTKIDWRKSTLTLQVNVRNAFNQSRVLPGKYSNDFIGIRRVLVGDPRTIRVSADINF